MWTTTYIVEDEDDDEVDDCSSDAGEEASVFVEDVSVLQQEDGADGHAIHNDPYYHCYAHHHLHRHTSHIQSSKSLYMFTHYKLNIRFYHIMESCPIIYNFTEYFSVVE